jgi:uncharacterized membrane protein
MKTSALALRILIGTLVLALGACATGSGSSANPPAAAPVAAVPPATPAPAAVPANPTPVAVVAKIDFDKQIKPIFTQYCYACHGPTADFPPGGVNLGVRKSALRAIAPGSPSTSLLFKVVSNRSMPPGGNPKPTARQIYLIRLWIAQGADWPDDAGG